MLTISTEDVFEEAAGTKINGCDAAINGNDNSNEHFIRHDAEVTAAGNVR